MRRRHNWISAQSCILLSMGLLILPLRWLLAAVAAAVVHELCHIAAVWVCGGHIHGVQIGVNGTVLDAADLRRGQMLLCSLAGPIGGLLLLFAAKWIPAMAVCAAFQSVYNLLPVYPLDGGRALRSGLTMVFTPKTALRICSAVEGTCLGAVLCGALYACVWLRLGIVPLILTAALFSKTKFGKIPCKLCRLGVQ